jgi:hypothetical protein
MPTPRFPRQTALLKAILAAAAFWSAASTHAADLILSGGMNYAAPTELKAGSDRHWTGAAAPTAGLTLDLPLTDLPLSLETGVFWKSSKSERTGSDGTTQITEGKWTDIPLLIHYHFDPSIRLGLGGYWSFLGSGDAVSPTESPDSGILLNLRARFRISETFSLILDARYLHGLSNLASSPADTYNSRSIQVLAGILYPVF